MLKALADGFYTYAVPAGLCVIMAGLGLSLSVRSLLETVTRPRALAIGLFSQMLLPPALAFLIAWLFSPPPVIAVGLVFLAACPGGITSTTYTYASRGDVALSVTMTTLSSLAAAVTMPLYAQLGLNWFGVQGEVDVGFPLLEIMRSLFLMTVAPITLGIIIRQRRPELARRLAEPVRKLALCMLILIIVGNAIVSFDTIVKHFATAGVIALVLNVAAMATGYVIARAFALPTPQVVAITYETGLHNIALAFTISMTLLRMPDYAITALLYALVMKITALAFLGISKRMMARAAAADAVPAARLRAP